MILANVADMTKNPHHEMRYSDVYQNHYQYRIVPLVKLKWHFNRFGNIYQKITIYCIRKISALLKIDELHPKVFLPNFPLHCIDVASTFQQFDANETPVHHAVQVMKHVLGLKNMTVNFDVVLESQEFLRLKKYYGKDDLMKKMRRRQKLYLKMKEKMIQNIFSKYDKLNKYANEITLFDFGDHLPTCELIHWAVASVIVGFKHGILVDCKLFPYIKDSYKIALCVMKFTDETSDVYAYAKQFM